MYHFRPIAVLTLLFVGSFGTQGSTAEENAERPARAAQCFLGIDGVRYGYGDCLFTPLDKMGSFRIVFDKGLSAQVKVETHSADYVDKLHLPGTKLQPWPGSTEISRGSGDASWSGPQGGDATTIDIGGVANLKNGCWISMPDTHVCAWDKGQRLYLGPTPVEPNGGLAWGERAGMSARIISSSGLDTENAIVTAERSRDGAIVWCRSDGDFSLECIRHTMEDDGPLARAKTTLRANCKTKTYTDFWSRNLKDLDDDILDLDRNENLAFRPQPAAMSLKARSRRCAQRPRPPHVKGRRAFVAAHGRDVRRTAVGAFNQARGHLSCGGRFDCCAKSKRAGLAGDDVGD